MSSIALISNKTYNVGTNGDLLKFMNSFFYLHPVFRYQEFASWKAEQGTINPSAVRKALLYHTKMGHLLNIRRGLYSTVPPTVLPEEVSVDPYLIAAKAAEDSILAYHTALEIHGVAYSIFEQFTFLTSQKIKPFEFQDRWFQTVAIPTALKNKDKSFGIEKVDRQGLTVYTTGLARTFVDVLDRIELSGGWEEVVRSLNNMVALDVNAVITYCLMLNNRILAAKVGFFLEQRQGAFAVPELSLTSLLKLKPITPQYVTKDEYSSCQLVKKWNLMLPIHVLQQSWDEPEHDV